VGVVETTPAARAIPRDRFVMMFIRFNGLRG
jgi:hypothetical protein